MKSYYKFMAIFITILAIVISVSIGSSHYLPNISEEPRGNLPQRNQYFFAYAFYFTKFQWNLDCEYAQWKINISLFSITE